MGLCLSEKGAGKKNPVPKKFPDRKIELGNNKQLRICAYPKKVPEKNRPQKNPHRKIELEYNKQLSGCVYLAVQHASYFFRWGVLPVESWPTFQKSVCACSFPESRSPQPAWLSGNLAVKLSSLQLSGPFPRNIRENIRPHLPPQAACLPVHTSRIHAVYQTRARGDNSMCGDRR